MAKKAFAQLSKAGKAARIKKIQANRDKYGVKQGLFRITRMSDHGERVVTDNKGNQKTVHAFGYQIVPAGAKNNDEGLADGTFMWVNELVNVTPKSQKVIDYRLALAKKLSNKNVKSVLAHVEYKITSKANKTYRDVQAVYEVNKKN